MHSSSTIELDEVAARVVAETQRWVEEIVLRHNFCPFAHRPFQQERIRYAVSQASEPEGVVEALMSELLRLHDYATETDSGGVETILLVTPNCLADFHDYNEFLNVVDRMIEQPDLDGVIQVASFHPEYQFADLDACDVRNYTNRSLYPMFHLILEESVAQARATHPGVHAIPQINMKLLERLGLNEARRQLHGCRKKA